MTAKTAVDRIWADLSDRRGIKHELNACDQDIQEEIRNRLQEIIEEECGVAIETIAPPSRARTLTAAADLLSAVRATLDVETEVCDSCQMHRHQNWDEKQGFDQLGSCELKIRKWAKKL